MLDLDLSIPLNQVRALIGDIDGSLIGDSVIDYLLTKHSGNVSLVAKEALGYILNQVAYYMREEAGDVMVRWDDLYNQLYERKKQLDKDTLYSGGMSLFIFGGTTKSEIASVKNDLEYVDTFFTTDEFILEMEKYGIDPDNPYIFS